MPIKVTLTGRLADILDKELSLSSPSTVGEAIREVAGMNEEAKAFLLDDEGKVRDNIIVLVNDENVDDLEQPLREGDVIFLLLPIAGG
jgi:molybdopterin converting factor small subunit